MHSKFRAIDLYGFTLAENIKFHSIHKKNSSKRARGKCFENQKHIWINWLNHRKAPVECLGYVRLGLVRCGRNFEVLRLHLSLTYDECANSNLVTMKVKWSKLVFANWSNLFNSLHDRLRDEHGKATNRNCFWMVLLRRSGRLTKLDLCGLGLWCWKK